MNAFYRFFQKLRKVCMILAPIGFVIFGIFYFTAVEYPQWPQSTKDNVGMVGALAMIVAVLSALIVMTKVPSGIEGQPLAAPTMAEKAAFKFSKVFVSFLFAFFLLLVFVAVAMLGG